MSQRYSDRCTWSRGWTKAALRAIWRGCSEWWRPTKWRRVPKRRVPTAKGCRLPKPAAAATKALGTRPLRAESPRPPALLLWGTAKGWRRTECALGRRQRGQALPKLRRPRAPTTKALTEGWRRLAGSCSTPAKCGRLAKRPKALGGAADAALLRAGGWGTLWCVWCSCPSGGAPGLRARRAGAAARAKVAEGVGGVPLRRDATIPAVRSRRLLQLLAARAVLRRSRPCILRRWGPKLRRASPKLWRAASELWRASKLWRAAPRLRLAAKLRWAAPELQRRALARLCALRRCWRPVKEVSQQILRAGLWLRRRRCRGRCSCRLRRGARWR